MGLFWDASFTSLTSSGSSQSPSVAWHGTWYGNFFCPIASKARWCVRSLWRCASQLTLFNAICNRGLRPRKPGPSSSRKLGQFPHKLGGNGRFCSTFILFPTLFYVVVDASKLKDLILYQSRGRSLCARMYVEMLWRNVYCGVSFFLAVMPHWNGHLL